MKNKMEILLIFNEKPRNPSKEMAIKIAEQNTCVRNGDKYKVIFDNISPDLIKLLELSRGWTTTEFFINEKEMKISSFTDVVLCYNKSACNGVCDKARLLSFYTLTRLIQEIKLAEVGELWNPEKFKMEIEGSEFFKNKGNDTYAVEKNKIKEKALELLELPLLFCEKINKDLILKQIDQLPEKFEIQPFSEDDDGEFSGFDDNEIARIKAKAEIEAPIIAKAIAKELKGILKK